MQKFYNSLRGHAKNVIDFEKKKILPLTNKELKPHLDLKICYICGKSMNLWKYELLES